LGVHLFDQGRIDPPFAVPHFTEAGVENAAFVCPSAEEDRDAQETESGAADTVWEVAVHEAGHAVAGELRGLQIIRVTIKLGSSGSSPGEETRGAVTDQQPPRFAIAEESG
jgi:hypothetical protein